MADRELTRLADRLDDLERSVYSRTGQAAHTTIIDGAINQVETYDTGAVDNLGAPIYGQRVVSRTGRQPDGGNTMVVLDGPTPPAPAGFTVTAGMGTLTIKWDGSFVGGAPTPSDFYATVVHLARTADLGSVILPSPVTAGAAVVAKDGDGVTIGGLDPQEYTVALVCVSQAGKWSVPSATQTATPDDGSNLPAVADIRVTAEQALELAGGKGKVYYQATAPTAADPVPPVTGDLWYDYSMQVLKQWTGSAWSTSVMDASQNIKANSVTASLLATQIVLASTLVAGPLNDSHAEINQEGISLWQSTVDGVIRTSRLGSTGGDDFLQVYSRTNGQVVASIDQLGGITGAQARLGRSAGDTYINGQKFEDYLTPLADGVVAWGKRETNGSPTLGAETKYLEVQVVLQRNRLYRVTANSMYMVPTGAGTAGIMVLRYSSGGAAVTTSSTQIQSTRTYFPFNGVAFTVPPLTAIINTAGIAQQSLEYRFLVSYLSEGPGQVYPVASSSLPAILTVEDMGPAINQVGIDASQSPPPSNTKQNYTTWWRCSDSATYQGNGTKRTDVGKEIVHGWDPSGYNGNGCGIAMFTSGSYHSTNSAEIGKTPSAALTGATITAVDFMLCPHHAYYNSGVTLYYTPSTYTSIPTTLAYPGNNYYGYAGFAIGEAKYVPANPGIYTAIILGQAPSSSLSYYGRIDGAGYTNAPVMRVSYTR